jgi:hypothetical protein
LRFNRSKIAKYASVAGVGAVLAVGIPIVSGADSISAIVNDQITSGRALTQLQQAQPSPTFKWSQERESLIDIERMQANSTQTTSFGFNQGDATPVWSCPSIGVPIAADTELTNPDQVYNPGDVYNGQDNVLPQVDPTGIYQGTTTGTYVVCVAPNGTTYLQYWEGFVDAVTGAATFNTATNSISLVGPSTINVKTRVGTDNSSHLKKGKK